MSSAATVASKAAKVALLGVDSASAAVLTDCFRHFKVDATVEPVPASADALREFSACVVPLDHRADPILRELRRSGQGIVVYGICGSVKDALAYAKWGINAVFHAPIREREACQVVRSTHLLLTKELRRYVRVPLVCPVTLETGTQLLQASSVEISAGGMLLTTSAVLKVPQAVLATLALPGGAATSIRSVVCWTRDDEGTAALRFDPTDTRRTAVRQWIDEYLGA